MIWANFAGQMVSLGKTLQRCSVSTFIPNQLYQERRILESQLVTLLDSCSNLSQIKQIHGHIVRKRLDQCCYVLAKLIRMLTKVGVQMDPYGRNVFHQVKYPNSPFLWTALIRGYSLQTPFTESVILYNSMRMQGVGPVSFTFTALLKACASALDVNLGMQIHAQAIRIGGFTSDLYVGNTMIDMYVKCGYLDCARKLFNEMPDRDEISWTSLIVAYARNGDMDSAGELFDGLPYKDMVAWTAMVTGSAQNARPKEALEFFKKMQESGVQTDEVTLVGVISACAQLGASKYANWVRDVAEKSGLGPDNNVVIGSALVDLYSKCGLLEDARNVFDQMRIKNVFSYSSMIVGFAMHSHTNAALDLFKEMVKNTDIKPNHVTLVGVLTACSHAGLVDQGQQIFTTMEKCYGVTPNVDHYACYVDLLGRAGQLKEALDVASKMPMKPHAGVWGALLGSCKTYGNPDIAEIAANHLFELEPTGIGNYVLLSNIYAAAGRWDDVARIRKIMRSKGLKKDPACSIVESKKGVIHEFFAGDTNHPKSIEIKQELHNIIDRLTKFEGYTPNLGSVPYDISDDDKKKILLTHSEKLALAYKLISGDNDGGIIRIVKNLRICEDCHMVMCGASKITGREILVRDNMRFHHFRQGKCSCNNFW